MRKKPSIPKKQSERHYSCTIFVTGGAGFIGSTYLNICVRRYPEYHFVNIDALTYAANLKNITILKEPNYSFEKADIRDSKKLEALFKKYKPTDVIHFAAESHVDLSIKNPHVFVETNINGTHNLLHLAHVYKINRFHQISTDEVYGSLGPKDPSFTEKTTLAPNSPYSAAKAAADLLVRAYVKTYGINAVVTRCSNNFGPGQDKTKLIPRFISLLMANKKVPLYSKGENVRDWLYVEDHIEAIDVVFHKGIKGEVYNVGGFNSEKTNLEITNILLKAFKKDASLIEFVADRAGHDFRYSIDSSKIEKELGWMPKVSFEDGIAQTIDFYKNL